MTTTRTIGRALPLLLAIALVLSLPFAAGAAGNARATLSGDEEVPPVTTEATGTFKLKANNSYSNASFTLRVKDGENITMAHLHCGEDGEEGPAVVTLFESNTASGTDADGLLASGSISDDDIIDATTTCPTDTDITDLESLIEAIEEEEVYANVHSTEYPEGLIRGQLSFMGTTTPDDDEDDDEENDDDDEENPFEDIEDLLEYVRELLRDLRAFHNINF
jgi:hypothetical protein